jgi:GH35 family endo-1,4-beta-xylanase
VIVHGHQLVDVDDDAELVRASRRTVHVLKDLVCEWIVAADGRYEEAARHASVH